MASRRSAPRRLRRPRTIALIALAAVVFLALSAELARWLSTENAERGAVTRLLAAQVRGDVPGMLAQLHGCAARPACVASVRANARRLHAARGERLEIAAYESGTAYALGSTTGPTRVAWLVAGRLPTVQCVQVARHGNLVAGLSVRLLSISAPIGRQAACP